MQTKENPGALAGATEAVHPHHTNDKGNCTLARKRRAKKAGTHFLITPANGDPFRIVVTGRNLWALESLCEAGPKGCTPIQNPAPRWSHYIRELRLLGVEIQTLKERHGGKYPGSHGRYVLLSNVVKEAIGGAPC